jgi:hypothetical protein
MSSLHGCMASLITTRVRLSSDMIRALFATRLKRRSEAHAQGSLAAGQDVLARITGGTPPKSTALTAKASGAVAKSAKSAKSARTTASEIAAPKR